MAGPQQSPVQISAMPGGADPRLALLARLRLVTGLILLLVALVGVLGTDWDIQWHARIGRDRTFTPPHDLILVSIGLAGIIALASLLIETIVSRQHGELHAYTVSFLGILHGSLGAYLVGFGAVCSAVAFPLDTYWHALYGIDVSLWAPFHTMIYMGSVLSTLGIVYHLLSSAHLGEMQSQRLTTILSYAGVVVGLGILLSKLSTFLTPSLRGYRLFSVSLFPFLMALTIVFICVLTVRTVPWLGAATAVVAVSLLIALVVGILVPPLTTQLAQAEHEVYAARAGQTVVPLVGQTPIIFLAALSIDAAMWLGRGRRWAQSTLTTGVLVAATISAFLVAGITLLALHVGAGARQGGGVRAFVVALLLTIPGSLLGNWAAHKISETMQALRW